MKATDKVLADRQKWFWRRTTLQTVLLALVVALLHSSFTTASLQNDWPTVATQALLTGAIVWLVSMYFAMVDNANKLNAMIKTTGQAIKDAREKDEEHGE